MGCMGIKDFVTRKVLEHKMKDVPRHEREVFMRLVTENPELFEKIGNEVKQKTKEGKSETAATMEVMRKYQGEVQKAMMN